MTTMKKITVNIIASEREAREMTTAITTATDQPPEGEKNSNVCQCLDRL